MSNDFSKNKPQQPSHIAYSVTNNGDQKNHWHQIGAAWPAKDDGLTIKLDAFPVDGRITLRSREALERLREQRQSQNQGQTQQQTIKP